MITAAGVAPLSHHPAAFRIAAPRSPSSQTGADSAGLDRDLPRERLTTGLWRSGGARGAGRRSYATCRSDMPACPSAALVLEHGFRMRSRMD